MDGNDAQVTSTTPRTLRHLGEQPLLDLIVPLYATTDPRLLLGPGDDAAVIAASDGRVVVTTDTMVRGQDWRDDWSSGHDVGGKLVTQNIADIAAMGAVPTGIVVTLVADPDTTVDWAVDVSRGIADRARRYGVPVAGGDLSSAPPGVATVSITATGDLQGREPVRRDGARPGDLVLVCGELGLAGGGLELLFGGITGRDESTWSEAERVLVTAQRSPLSPVEQGPVAATHGAHAMLDLSDGLVRDARRVAAASGVRIDLDRQVLAEQAAGPLTAALDANRAFHQVMVGGEGHALLATCPPDAALATMPGWLVVGRVHGLAAAERASVTLDGRPVDEAGGWDHFGG